MRQHMRWLLIAFIQKMEWTLSDAAKEFNITQEKLFRVTNGAYIDRGLYHRLLKKMVYVSRIEEQANGFSLNQSSVS
jgi:uncharacterized membrane protein